MSRSEFREDAVDLMISAATEGFAGANAAELSALLESDPAAQAEYDDLELAATLTHLALLDATPSARARMPAEFRSRFLAATRESGACPDRLAQALAHADEGAAGTASQAVNAPVGPPRSGGRLGWALAAGIALAWGATTTLQVMQEAQGPGAGMSDTTIADTGQAPPPPAPAPGPSLDEQRQALLADAPDAVTVPWSSQVDEFNGVAGDVVWSTERQEGYLRFAAMPTNEPTVAQYQLWIVDPERDKEPVDGGVFDVVASDAGEVIVPIHAKLDVVGPAAFAVTREKPGGVVVSEGPLLLVAAL